MHATQNQPVEWAYTSGRHYDDAFQDVRLHAHITYPNGDTRRLPAFWGGEQSWRFRFSSSQTGTHAFTTVCSDTDNLTLHHRSSTIEVGPYNGDNPLFRHGGLRKSPSSAYLEHQDSTPFFWLADTWWMGLCRRLGWPGEFQTLTHDRASKGFSVIQIVAGLYPDMAPFDERSANEAGFPWSPDFSRVNPRYFDMADLRIDHLVRSGLVPCIVGCWGYYLDVAGEETITRHWDYLVARYGAYPVVWCLAGEALMPFYLNEEAKAGEGRDRYQSRAKESWTRIARHIRETDPHNRPVTIHPTQAGRDMVDDPAVLDLDMLQTGHGSYCSLAPTAEAVGTAVERTPRLPVINSEVCYEGICGSSGPDIQRFVFWSSVLSGACGHTYGANGIWQVNTRQHPYGPSPHGATWGNTPWDEAAALPGSTQVGLGRRLLERYRWWEFEPHPQWLDRHAGPDDYLAPYAAGIPGEVRVIFLPILNNWGWGETRIRDIEPDVRYHAFFFDPFTGEEHDQGTIVAHADGSWTSGKAGIFQDWVLVLERVGE